MSNLLCMVPTVVNFLVYLLVNFLETLLFSDDYDWNTKSSTALLLLVNPYMLHQNNGTVCPTYLYQVYCLKRRCFIARYFQSFMQQYKSTTVKKNFCNQSSHYENYRRFPEAIMYLP